jgi:hypothetical protein
MDTLIAHAQPDVGDLRSPDPEAVEWLEAVYWPSLRPESWSETRASVAEVRPMFETLGERIFWRYCPSCDKLIGTCEHVIVIEPDDEILQDAAADFRDGFWVGVPYGRTSR